MAQMCHIPRLRDCDIRIAKTSKGIGGQSEPSQRSLCFGSPLEAKKELMASVAVARRFYVVCLLALFLVPLALGNEDTSGLDVRAGQRTAVRFFYEPPGNSYFHTPLVFVAVSDEDPRLNSAPSLESGRTAFVRVSEMKSLLDGLRRLGLAWRVAPERTSFGPAINLDHTGKMDITVISSNATAIASIEPKHICRDLSSLDSALSTPRALWELQKFAFSYDCNVPGFDNEAYPDHGP
jgi:hypothetical protein